MVCSLFFLICQWQGAGTEEACLIDILASRSNDEIKAINAFYKKSESQRTSMNRYSMRGPGPACRDTWYCIVPLTKLPYGHWLTSVTFYEHTADRRNEVSGRICFNRLFCFLDLMINSVFGFVTGASSIPHFATKVNFFFCIFLLVLTAAILRSCFKDSEQEVYFLIWHDEIWCLLNHHTLSLNHLGVLISIIILDILISDRISKRFVRGHFKDLQQV